MINDDIHLAARVSWRVVKAFDVEARRRGKKRSWLVARVLTLVAKDQIFDAVIDDGKIADGEQIKKIDDEKIEREHSRP